MAASRFTTGILQPLYLDSELSFVAAPSNESPKAPRGQQVSKGQRERGKHAGRPRYRLDSAEVKSRLSSAYNDFINSETAVSGAEGPDAWVIWGWISGSVPEQRRYPVRAVIHFIDFTKN